MTEKPILFSTPMVKAILSGSKFQTRRVVKPQPEIQNRKSMLNSPYCTMDDGSLIFATAGSLGEHRNPPYQPGTILYVRETWYYEEHMHDLTAGEPDLPGGRYSHRYVYKATNPDYPVNVGVGEQGWKPSIHMPREAARLFLRVKNVRVERLQDITEEDARDEGVKDPYDYQAPEYYEQPHMRGFEINKSAFAGLWDSIYSKPKKVYAKDEDGNIFISHYESFPFDGESRTETYKGKPHYICANPWVWAIEFERIPAHD